MPAFAVVLWLGATLFWWAFAFMPLPSAPPEWLAAARVACFGVTAHGLPAASGWLLLVLAPVMLLAVIIAVWGHEVTGLLRRTARGRAGRSLAAALAVVVLVEGTWVSAKIRTAWRMATPEASADVGELPRDYPRQLAMAADFTLVDQHGATITLGRFRGHAVIVTFVFSHCASLCPVVVETVKRVGRDAMPVEILLVTLDPWRDTPSALATIARQWGLPAHAHLLSSGKAEEVVSVARAYGVPFQRDDLTGDIAHPGLVFVVDAQGRLAYTFNSPPVAWLRQALARLD
jgi:cytochrome oxidase Cu insertion factor (SCO1/SenC/PrrC family)